MANEDRLGPHPFDNKSEAEIANFRQKVLQDVLKAAIVPEKPPESVDNSLVFVEEWTLETERGGNRIYLTKYVFIHLLLVYTNLLFVYTN